MTVGAPELVELCAVEDLADGEVRTARVKSARLGVIRDGDSVKVILGGCPHHGGPLDRGQVRSAITGAEPGDRTIVPGARVLICPWHSYEFDLDSGCAVADPKLHLRFIPHEIQDGKVFVTWPLER